MPRRFVKKLTFLVFLRGKEGFPICDCQGFDHGIDIARHERIEGVLAKPDAMNSNAALGKIVGADTFATIPRAYHGSAAILPRFGVLPVIKIVDTGTEYLKRPFFVFELGTLVLTGYDDARREVRDANGRSDFIDVLPACAA